MTDNTSQRWIMAGIKLANDPSSLVECPNCQSAPLVITDAPRGDKVERWMQCHNCKAWNTLLMKANLSEKDFD